MAPRSSYSKMTTPFPIFAAEFDPYNRGYLVVGGGGGEGRSGVPNQIAVLDVSNRADITTAVTVDLSRDEDSVQSLASLATKDGLITFAGINSSQAAQNAGKNEHLRSFEIKYPPRKKQKTEDGALDTKSKADLIGKRALFKQEPAAKSERYQRLLRLSPVQRQSSEGSKRIGAIASGLSKQAEVVVFDATTSSPEDADILARIEPEDGAEVVDMDIANTGTNEFSLTYCTDYDICEQSYQYDFATKKTQKTPKGPRRIHSMPDGEGAGAKHKFRCLRFLDSQNVIALVNRANKKGTELRVFHLYPTGPASMILQMQLPSHIKQAVSMDVCALDTDSQGDRQIAVAVAGQDISIQIWTLNYTRSTDTFSRFRSFYTCKDVHAHQMTKICFSPFRSPVRAPTPSTSADDKSTAPAQDTRQNAGPQSLKLASVSYGNTVVVDDFPLSPLNPKDRHSRYILSNHAAEKRRQYIIYAVVSFVVLMFAILAQAYLSAPASGNSALSGLLPPGARPYLDKPANAAHDAASAISSSLPTNIPGVQRLADLLSHPSHSSKALIVRDSPTGTDLSVDAHADKEALLKEHVEAKHWDELHEDQRSEWKRRLVEAGRWAESEGESVLKGVMWSSYAGFVGGVAGEVLKEL